MKNVVILFLLLALPSFGFAGEAKVTGAFGFKFGETYDEKKALRVERTEQGEIYYIVSSKKPFKSFNSYMLSMSPATNVIYAISATGLFENIRSCEQERTLIINLLKKKYPLKDVTNDVDEIKDKINIIRHNAVLLKQDYISIVLSCKANGKLIVIYGDEELGALAEKERLKVQSKKVDSSGL